jgi:hypothetical protein
MKEGLQDYFGSDYVYDVEIGLYELVGYAKAKSRYKQLIRDYDKTIEFIYTRNIAPGTVGIDYMLGNMHITGLSAEAQALKIIDEKEVHQAKIIKERRKMDMFKRAMMKLDELEQAVIRTAYQGKGDRTDLSHETFYEILRVAEEKLINYLQQDRQSQFDEILRKKRADLKAKLIVE